MLAIFLDTETTGLDPALHSLLEIAFKVVDLSSGNEKIAYQAIVKQPSEVWEKRDPMSITVNGFSWEKVESGREIAAIREEIIELFTMLRISRGTAVYICQNPAFDRNFFAQIVDVYTQEVQQWPYHWLDFASMYWALHAKYLQEKRNPFPEQLNLSKNAIAKQYGLPIEPLPHSAMNGVDHLLMCYRTVVGFAYSVKDTFV